MADKTDKSSNGQQETGPAAKVPASLYIRSPLMQIGGIVGKMVNAYNSIFKIKSSDMKSVYLKKLKSAELRGDIPKCIELLERIIALDSNDSDMFYQLGLTHERAENLDAAIKAYHDTLKLKPDFVRAQYRIGVINIVKREFKAAIKALELAKKMEPDSAEINFRLGLAHDRLNDYDKAITFFKKAVAAKPGFLVAYKNMALTYDSMNRHKEAVECLKRALELEERASD